MKTLLLTILFAAPSAAAPLWHDDLSAGLALAVKEGKPVVLDFYGVWCPPCQAMDREVMRSGALGDLEDRFIFVHLDADRLPPAGPHRAYPVAAYPTVWVLGSSGKPLGRYVGYESKEDFIDFLRGALEGKDRAREAEERLAKSPHDPSAVRDAYSEALAAGRRDRAVELRKMIEKNRDRWLRAYEGARYEEIATLLSGSEPAFEAAFALADAFLADLPGSDWTLLVTYQKAKALRGLERMQEADALAASLPGRWPDEPAATTRLLEYARRNATLREEASRALEEGLKRFPDDERLVTQALLLIKDSDRARARELAGRLKKLKPDNSWYDELVKELGS